MFGVEAVSPNRPGLNNFEVHHVCRDLGFTQVPLKIRGGTASPIRAVATVEGKPDS